MPNTDQYWQADTFQPDYELFVGVTESKDTVNGQGGITFSTSGIYRSYLNQGASCCVNVTAALKRTGILASPAIQQQQFGTAASQPGPSIVTYTSDPEGIRGFPPFTASKMPTLIGTGGALSGSVPKGIQINSLDVIYDVSGGALTSTNLRVDAFTYVDGGAIISQALLALGQYSLPKVATSGGPYRRNIPMTITPILNTSGTDIQVLYSFVSGAGVTNKFYGIILKCSQNLT